MIWQSSIFLVMQDRFFHIQNRRKSFNGYIRIVNLYYYFTHYFSPFSSTYNMPDLQATKKRIVARTTLFLLISFIIQLQVILSAGLCFRSIVFNASASDFLSYKTIPNSTRLFLFAFSFFRIFFAVLHFLDAPYQRFGKQIAGLKNFWYNMCMGKLKM